MREHRHNPFASRLADLFGSNESHDLSFAEFLSLYDAFHAAAPAAVKNAWAFAIWDFDGELGMSAQGQDETNAPKTRKIA